MPDVLHLLLSPPARVEREEMIDIDPEATPEQFAGTFRDIARVNQYLGGTRATLSALARMVAALPPSDFPLRILDVATGAGDVPRAILHAARRGRFGNRPLAITATDAHPAVVELARRWAPPNLFPEVTIERADALSLPYAEGAFDIALCSLTLHHFSEEQAVQALHEMERVTTVGWIVNDLLRDRMARNLIWALTRLVRAHPYTCHDAPVSVMRAYTLSEYTELARRAGILDTEARAIPMYRALLVRERAQATKRTE